MKSPSVKSVNGRNRVTVLVGLLFACFLASPAGHAGDGQPCIQVTKSCDTVVAGQPNTVTATVVNCGIVTLNNIQVTDDLYGNIGTIASLAPGGTATLTKSVTNLCGIFIDTVTVTGTDDSGNSVTASGSATCQVTENPCIAVTKTCDGVTVGQSNTVTAVVTNCGNVPINGIAVTDDLYGSIGTIVSLTPGGSATFTKTVTNSCGNFPNTVTAAGTSACGTPVQVTSTAVCAVFDTLHDVTQPGDPIVPTSNNSPGAEGVANAIDNQPTKYLNFDRLNTGFTVTPSQGASILDGLSLTSANDAPERDPASYELSGSVDGTTFVLISSGPVALFPARFYKQYIFFSNSSSYSSYRLIFPEVVGPGGNSMQISEVEFLEASCNQPPVAKCKDIVVGTDANCQGSGSVDDGSFDPDGDPITVDQSPAGPYPLGTNHVTLCVSDNHGASNCCNATVVVMDATAPTITCPEDIVVASEPGQCLAVVNYTVNASDNCDLRTLLSEDFDAGDGGFTVLNGIGANPTVGAEGWTYNAATGSWRANGGLGVKNSTLNTPLITLTQAGEVRLAFAHRYNFEDDGTTRWDAGAVFVSVNGGPFTYLPAGAFVANGYAMPRTIGGNSPPLNGLFGFNNTSTGFGSGDFITSVASLGSFAAGDSIAVRFLGAWDEGFVQTPAPNWEITSVALAVGGGSGSVTVVCDPPSGSTFPVGTNIVCCTATDAAGNTNTCCFTVTVEDKDPPQVACLPGYNPSGKKVPVAGKNPASGQNPDGYYQLLSKDDCDASPEIYIVDTGSDFIAGPFASGDVIKLTQSPGKQPSQDPAPDPIVAHIHLRGDGLLFAVDAFGNESAPELCLVPRPPK